MGSAPRRGPGELNQALALDAAGDVFAGVFRGQITRIDAVANAGDWSDATKPAAFATLPGSSAAAEHVLAANRSTLFVASSALSTGNLPGGGYLSSTTSAAWTRVYLQNAPLVPFGSAGTGLCEVSTDGPACTSNDGATWWTATSAVSISAAIPDPLGAKTLWLGTTRGVYRSSAGASFVATDLTSPTSAFASRGSTLYAATDAGVWSSDDGAHWAKVGAGLEAVAVYALAVAPSDPNVMVAAAGSDVYALAGGMWSPVPNTKWPVAFDPHDATKLYSAAGRSTDGGRTFTGPAMAGATAIAFDLERHGVVYFANSTGVYRSKDGAATFTMLGALDGDSLMSNTVTDLRVSAIDARVLVAGGRTTWSLAQTDLDDPVDAGADGVVDAGVSPSDASAPSLDAAGGTAPDGGSVVDGGGLAAAPTSGGGGCDGCSVRVADDGGSTLASLGLGALIAAVTLRRRARVPC
jgi:MYXO-CTERM domain-containing protein